MKHIDVTYLWIQDEVRSRRLQVRRVKSEDNIADLGTKPLGKAVIAKHCTAMGYMNMSQEDAQMGHQSWGCFETLDQCAAGDHVQKTGGSEPQQRKHPQQLRQSGAWELIWRSWSTSANIFSSSANSTSANFDFGQFRIRPVSTSANFEFGQFRLRPISTSANFDFGQFDFGQLADVELAEVELAEVENHRFGNTPTGRRAPGLSGIVAGNSPTVLGITCLGLRHPKMYPPVCMETISNLLAWRVCTGPGLDASPTLHPNNLVR